MERKFCPLWSLFPSPHLRDVGPVAPVGADLPGVVSLCVGMVTEGKIFPWPLLCFSDESDFVICLDL